MSLNSAIAQGITYHHRLHPKDHRFHYKINYMWLDLDETSTLQAMLKKHWLLRPQLKLSDYLGQDEQSLKEKALNKLSEFLTDYTPEKVVMLGQLRWFGMYFSPVNFYFFSRDEHYDYAIAEVTNTPWLDKHYYCIDLHTMSDTHKAMHVSPFNPMDMQYHWLIDLDEEITIQIDCIRQKCEFRAGMQLERHPLTTKNMRQFARRYAFTSAFVMFRIYYQALRLWLKKIPVYPRPNSH